jgi:hypothetical protein
MGVSCIVDSISGIMSRYTLNCYKRNNRCKLDLRVRIQYDISDSEWALKLSPEVLTSSMRVWRTLHTEGIYPYHIQRIQHIEPADTCNRLELCRWINSNPHMIGNILFTDAVHTRWTQEKNYSSEFSALQEASTTLQCCVSLQVLWSHASENLSNQMENTSNNLLECLTANL